MKIAIIGHGRMGRLVEEIARARHNEISCIIDAGDEALYASREFRESDVAIQFTTPATALDGILASFAAKVPIVVGTTGWTGDLPVVREMCQQGKGTLLYSSNFSIGMNVFMSVNRYLATIMNRFDSYAPKLEEVHHVHKLDHPSGTAVTLAEELVKAVERIGRWVEKELGHKPDPGFLPVYHRREGEVPGIHTVTWESDADIISMTHEAKNRTGFATGAVMAAEWLASKKGFHTMAEFLADVTKTNGIFNP